MQSEWKPLADAPVGLAIIVQWRDGVPICCMGPYTLDTEGVLWDDAIKEPTEHRRDDTDVFFIPCPPTGERS